MESSELVLVLGTLLLVGIVTLLGYLLARRPGSAAPAKNVDSVPETTSSVDTFEMNEQTTLGGSKRQAKNKKRRDVQQEFVHSWLIGSFKGHSAPILDMDFSANGKYLASCAEDCEPEMPIGDTDKQDGQQQMIDADGSPPPASAAPSDDASAACASPPRTSLSRRQRKNRKLRFFREEAGAPASSSAPAGAAPDPGYDSERPGQPKPHKPPHKTHKTHKALKTHKPHKPHKPLKPHKPPGPGDGGPPQLLRHLGEAAVVAALRLYVPPAGQLAYLGFPVELVPGRRSSCAVVLHQQPPSASTARFHQLDANAREFVPSGLQLEPDSGHASAGSSLESSDLEQEGSASDSASDCDKGSEAGGRPALLAWDAVARSCSRCAKTYYVSRESGDVVAEERCLYHWGRLGQRNVWSCCRNREGSRGCASGRVHVWTGLVPGCNGPFPDYVRTRPAPYVAADGNYGAYAVDAEMCFTRRGLELARLTLLALDGSVAYEALVRPDCEVLDYNTRFSGLRARDLVRASKSLRDVQRELLEFLHAETILVGHAVHNDLRALRLLHTEVVDTSLVYPHHLGHPFKHSLRTLARTLLCREIQQGEHDSAEDARAALDLMLRQVQLDLLQPAGP